MKKILPLFVLSLLFAPPALSQAPSAPANAVTVEVGRPLVDVDGKRIGAVYRVGEDGSAQVIVDGKIYVVPIGTLSIVGDKLVTSLTKKEVLSKR